MSGQVSRAAREQLEAVFRAGLVAVDPAALIRARVWLQGSALIVERADHGQAVCGQKDREEHGPGRDGSGLDNAGRGDAGWADKEPISLDLDDYRRVVVLAAGKGAAPMCLAMRDILGERLDSGLAVTKYGHGPGAERIELLEAGHPVPDENGVAAARRMLELAASLGPEDLALVLLSGGGSALLPCPAEGLTLAHKQEATRLLLACGADIGEINTVRKHLSAIKGGGLLRALAPATCLTLALSDVMPPEPDNQSSGVPTRNQDAPTFVPLSGSTPVSAIDSTTSQAADQAAAMATASSIASSIASGSTAPDPTTYQDALAVLERYGVEDKMPAPVLEHLRRGLAGQAPETLKQDDPILERAPWVLLGDNETALKAAANHARSLGWEVVLLDRPIRGEAREEAVALARGVREVLRERASGQGVGPGTGHAPRFLCLLAGGESVVTLRGQGRGGRNQEMALAFLREMLGREMAGDHSLAEVTFLAASTDGTDGPTDAAGAFADSTLLRRDDVDAASLDAALADNDSHTFFDRRGGLLRTGPTGTNVCDLALALIP